MPSSNPLPQQEANLFKKILVCSNHSIADTYFFELK
jgi:hypothetical protein